MSNKQADIEFESSNQKQGLLDHKDSTASSGAGKQPPVDNGVVTAIFFIYGVGILLPWNAVLSCFDYFVFTVSHQDITRSELFILFKPN